MSASIRGIPPTPPTPGPIPYYFEPLLDPPEAAALLGIHEKTLIRLAREGKVPAKKIGKLWKFRASELDAWLKNQAEWASRSE